MNKTDLIEHVAQTAAISKVKAKRAIDATMERIKDAVKRGENVTLVGFGTFDLGGRRTRVGRNPRTGEALTIEAARVPKFRPGKAFKNDVK
ncbi:MAG: HU family DNA-binding protein [Janthinobacterium lividum]